MSPPDLVTYICECIVGCPECRMTGRRLHSPYSIKSAVCLDDLEDK